MATASSSATASSTATASSSGPITLPPLPWAENALEPVISAKTISFHYGKHHKTYVDTVNKMIARTARQVDQLGIRREESRLAESGGARARQPRARATRRVLSETRCRVGLYALDSACRPTDIFHQVPYGSSSLF